MRVITFGTLKGGVGKTMLCFNIGGILSQIERKVLIVDSDLQGNLTNNIGIDRTRPGLCTLYDIYENEWLQPLPEELVYTMPNPKLPNLDIIPGSIFLHKAELRLAAVDERELILKKYLERHKSFFNKYEYILIDTNPSMSIVNQNAFAVSDSILLISDVSMNAIEGAQLFMALWEDTRRRLGMADNVKGFIVNDYDGRNRLSSDFVEYLKNDPDTADIRTLLVDTVIPRTVKITESELAAIPISLYDVHSKGCVAISNLIVELVEKEIL